MLWVAVAAGMAGGDRTVAAPFAETLSFRQPDGTGIELWGEGNEFYAVFETLDGYAVVFDPDSRAYHYARLSPDGTELWSTGVWVGQGNPQALGLTKHLRISPDAVRRQVARRFAEWDREMEVSVRWNALKASVRAFEGARAAGVELGPPSFQTVGLKVGLTLLVDFDDSPATIPRDDVEAYCNGDNYGAYGNNGSVKEYFYDVSNGKLVYSNVVTLYVRIPNTLHPKSYYTDTTQDCGRQGNYLIRDALNILKALPNYATEILPLFDALTVDGNNRVVACNVFYAGGNGGVWSKGLWPHSWSLYTVGEQSLSAGGKKIYRYQITNIGSTLSLGTFCHENGHMLCGFPDIYDYDYDSAGGAGRFCLMNSGASGGNPAQVCAYLKRAAGWATTTEFGSNSVLTAVLTAPPGTNFNHFYRYAKPGVPTEYFLLENRQRTGRDAGIPASGIAVWHIDERGDKDNQSLITNTVHANYEVTLVQADNEWHFQRDLNSGDSRDLYYLGNAAPAYLNRFTDATAPAAHWWDGTPSGLKLRTFSASGPTMTVSVDGPGGAAPPLIAIEPKNQNLAVGHTLQMSVTADGTEPLAYQWSRNGAQIPEATHRTWSVAAAGTNDSGTYQVAITNAFGAVTSAPATAVVYRDAVPPFPPGAVVLIPVDCSQINIHWSRSGDLGGAGTTGYRVFRDGVLAGETPHTSFSDTGLAATTRYCYTVTAYDASGNESQPSASSCAATFDCFVSEWIAFNDHYAGAGTHSNASAWNVFGTVHGAPGSAGPLRNIASGAALPVSLAIASDDAGGGTSSGRPSAGTPADLVFKGYVDFGSGEIDHAITVGEGAWVTHTLSGLDMNRFYSLKGTGIRGNAAYTNRWVLVELEGAESFTPVHSPGALTSLQVPAIPEAAVALNTGANAEGDLFDWENVQPGADGILTIRTRQYTNTVPDGSALGAPYGYGLVALRVEGLHSTNTLPVAILEEPASLTVPEGGTASFSVRAGGHPRFFQWHVDGEPIPGATWPTYVIPVCGPGQAGTYTLVVTNAISSATSSPIVLSVALDHQGPRLLGALAWLNATNILVTFSEPVEPGSATTNVAVTYSVTAVTGSGALAVSAAELVSPTNVLLTTSPRAPGYNYWLTVAHVTDRSSLLNPVAPNPSQVHIISETLLMAASAAHAWRYTEAGYPGAHWMDAGFDDAAWPSGHAVFSQNAAEGGLPSGFVNRTALRAPSAGGPMTVYFRTAFQLPGPPQGVQLHLRSVVDDGAVFYLNGAEVHRVRMDPGLVDFQTTANDNATEPHPLEDATLDAANLREGTNCLAVEVHQDDANSSDIVLAAELVGVLPQFTEPPPPTIVFRRSMFGQILLSWSVSGYTLQQSDAVTGPWTNVVTTINAHTASFKVHPGLFYRLMR